MTADQVKAAIDKLFGDTSVTADVTLRGLYEVRDHLQANINALEDDLLGRGE